MPNNMPLVCICVPTYNAEGTVKETLESILAQNYSNLIVIVSDNASTDNTLKVLESVVDSRLTIHRSAENIGAEGNFNRCIQLAEGKYAGIFHADDIYEPNMVAMQVQFLEANAEVGAVFSEASLIDEDGQKIGRLGMPNSLVSADALYDFRTIFKSILQHSNFLICPSVLARTEVYQKVIKTWNGTDFKTSADLDVWLRMLQFSKIGIIQENLMRYRISTGQYSERLRMRTARSDFFLVMDYYLAQESVCALLTQEDWRNFSRLERTDRTVRAVNLYLQGQDNEARKLCADFISMDAIQAAVHDRRGLFTFVAGILLKIFITFRLAFLGKPLLRRLKRIARK